MSLEQEHTEGEVYTAHPSPGYRDKIEAADRRMRLRLYCCGIDSEDYMDREVLDAGCGTGEYSLWFASNGARVTGIDLSPASLREASSYAERHGIERVDFEKRSVLDTGFAPQSFDFVYCTGVLHHTPAPFRGFRELHRVLRPGGKLLVSLYNRAGMWTRELRRQIVQLLASDDPRDRIRWARRLFPLTADRLYDEELSDPETRLNDYFGVDRQSLHTVGEVLDWLDRCELDYEGSFPPARLSDYPGMFAHSSYESVERELKDPLQRLIGSLAPGSEMERQRPGVVDRIAVQLMWLVKRMGIFSVCGSKPTGGRT